MWDEDQRSISLLPRKRLLKRRPSRTGSVTFPSIVQATITFIRRQTVRLLDSQDYFEMFIHVTFLTILFRSSPSIEFVHPRYGTRYDRPVPLPFSFLRPDCSLSLSPSFRPFLSLSPSPFSCVQHYAIRVGRRWIEVFHSVGTWTSKECGLPQASRVTFRNFHAARRGARRSKLHEVESVGEPTIAFRTVVVLRDTTDESHYAFASFPSRVCNHRSFLSRNWTKILHMYAKTLVIQTLNDKYIFIKLNFEGNIVTYKDMKIISS